MYNLKFTITLGEKYAQQKIEEKTTDQKFKEFRLKLG